MVARAHTEKRSGRAWFAEKPNHPNHEIRLPPRREKRKASGETATDHLRTLQAPGHVV